MTKDALEGVNVVLMGPSGSGKTYSIGTLVDSGIEVFYLALENGLESLLGYYADNNKEIPSNLHWHRIEPKKAGFQALIDSATKINIMDQKTLASSSDTRRKEYDSFLKIVSSLSNFIDDRTGISYGSVDSWGTDRVIVVDGLTGINNAAMNLVVGGKPMKSQSDWQIAQSQVETLLTKLCDDCNCHFVLLAHIEREHDEIMGGIKLTMSTLGKALLAKLPRLFSDIILTTRDGLNFYWDTIDNKADVKTRNLPMSSKNPPDFKAILKKWNSRNDAGKSKEVVVEGKATISVESN